MTSPKLWPSSLLTRFILLSGAVVLAGMLIVGLWVTSRIEEGATDNAAAVTALYVDAIITPIVQGLALDDALTPKATAELADVLSRGALRDQVSAFILWTPQGKAVFGNDPQIMGRTASVGPGLATASSGEVYAEFDGAHQDAGSQSGRPLLEIYAPVRSSIDGKIIAVAEFYTTADTLAGHILTARLQSWVVVGLIGTGMLLTLSLLVAQGSRTIVRQRRALDAQVNELSVLLDKNSTLTQRLEEAHQRTASLNERSLRRVSADLHDGPVQQLAFAALCLDTGGADKQAQVRRAIEDATREIRHICGGLALPDLDDWSLATIARRLAATQETRNGGKVTLDLASDLPALPAPVKICTYRFIQEALTNGAKHAAGASQTVRMRMLDGELEVEVGDDGPGFDPAQDSEGLGLPGLRERVAALKGSLTVTSGPGRGTTLRMRLPARAEEPA